MSTRPLRFASIVAACSLAVLACSDVDQSHTSSGERRGEIAGSPSEKETKGAQALASVLNEPDVYRRAERLAALLQTFGVEELPDVKAVIEAQRFGESVSEFALLFSFWADHEPGEAASWSLELGKARFKLGAIHTAFKAWGASDPTAALAGVYGANLSNEDVSRTAQMALYEGWFEHDRAALEQYAQSLGFGKARQRVVFAYALSLATADGPVAVTKWAESIPDEPEPYKQTVLRQAMSALTWVDMPAALEWCEVRCAMEGGDGLHSMIMRSRLNRGEPAGSVIEWVSTMPRGEEERKVSLRTAYALWAHDEPDAAVEWMRMMTSRSDAPTWLEYLYPRFALLLATDSPREALEWGARVPDAVQREAVLIRVAQIWRVADEKAADEWLDQSSLSEEAQQKARESQKRPPLFQ